MEKKKLRKGKTRLIYGVCAGIAEYLGWPVWAVRTLAVAALIVFKMLPVIAVYLLLALALPDHLGRGGFWGSRRAVLCLAAALVALGLYIIIRVLLPQVSDGLMMGAVMIVLGGYLIYRFIRINM